MLKKIFRYGIFQMIPGESSCQGRSEYVWQRSQRVLKAKLKVAEVDPRFEKKDHLRKIDKGFGIVIGQSLDIHWIVIGQPLDSHWVVIILSSDSHRTVIGQSSNSRRFTMETTNKPFLIKYQKKYTKAISHQTRPTNKRSISLCKIGKGSQS